MSDRYCFGGINDSYFSLTLGSHLLGLCALLFLTSLAYDGLVVRRLSTIAKGIEG